MEDNKNTAVEVVDIQFRPGQKIYYFDPKGHTCKTGDHVIIDTARGPEFGIVAGGNHHIPGKDVVSPLRPVLRMANAQDERIVEENLATEKRAYAVCQDKITEYGLDMQLNYAISCLATTLILNFFTAVVRVDFRELVKNLASTFHTRIELRQIGVRDKAKMVGGLGICGRPFCCASFLDDFQPVSIKMAKTQNLSLNPTKISGTCGRLMCCLKYEQDAYEDLLRTAPKMDSFVDTPDGRGTIIEVDLLRQRVKVRLEKEPDTIVNHPNDEIAVLRSGKAKKNDPPIPEDLAPISGAGKRIRREEPEKTAFLDPIKFFEETEEVPAPSPEVEESPVESADEKPKHNRRNRHRNRHHGENKDSAPKTETAKPDAPKAESAQGEEQKSNRRRRNRHRHHKPKQNNAE